MRLAYIEGTVVKETSAAILLETDDGKTWIPKIMVVDPADTWEEGEEVEIEVPEWFAEKEGLI